ncbi:GNAT family N-acetyltransferase [Bradyrhizobium septentrionale]|uniref:GNAT family N-acetyltransferase n=1 Tax=Bradyrhizobium septentrionale TaxID=1404411 RepID=A0A973W7Y4_9BRAD|nr:GNAT family N-acetyltransferase [Bradyrhizobium septentrionale]UGY17574.1 GNAT family N-acetyltransferase [Bradyrhizobium septentrionale]UGY26311.1 GNAT family N-acetyltransferase [Bradyrhizobium septentrionale]
MCGAGRSSIRPARSADATFIARIVLAAQRGPLSRGWTDIALDRPEPECLDFMARLAIARVRSWYHVAHFLIAEVDGVPAAALCALPASGTVVAARAAIAEVAPQIGADPAAIVARGGYARNCWVQGGEGDWLIEHVATEASHRGGGLVQALIGRALADGKAAGFAQASISFVIGNEAAERCYAQAGFSFAEEKRDTAFEALTGAPGFRRFARGM